MKRKIFVLALLAVFLVGCETPVSDSNDKNIKEEIKTASLGEGFTINNEEVCKVDGTVFSSLNTTVTAYVHNNEISTGTVTNGVLSITIPSVNESFLISQLNNEDLKFKFEPSDVKTGELILVFMDGSTKYVLQKGHYNSLYNMLDNEIKFVYMNKSTIETGSFTESDTNMTMNVTAKGNYVKGWNKANINFNFSITNNHITIDALMTTNPVNVVNKWYIKEAD